LMPLSRWTVKFAYLVTAKLSSLKKGWRLPKVALLHVAARWRVTFLTLYLH
jgi:hypothetical protein